MKLAAFLVSALIGIGASTLYTKAVKYYQARSIPTMIGKCYADRDPEIRSMGMIEKVVKGDRKTGTVTTAYTFTTEPAFFTLWACLQKVGCDEYSVDRFLRKNQEVKCPW